MKSVETETESKEIIPPSNEELLVRQIKDQEEKLRKQGWRINQFGEWSMDASSWCQRREAQDWQQYLRRSFERQINEY